MSDCQIKNPPTPEYTYVVELRGENTFSMWMYTLYNDKVCGHSVNDYKETEFSNADPHRYRYNGLLISDEYKVEGITFYYKNMSKSGVNLIWVKQKSDWYTLFNRIHSRWLEVFPPPKAQEGKVLIYDMDSHGRWSGYGVSKDHRSYDLIGYSAYRDQIIDTIKLHRKHLALLESIGEAKSLNIALYGPPGVGKTTLCNTVASVMNIPIYSVKPDQLNSSEAITRALNPICNNCLVLFEDFDRFLDKYVQNPESNFMSPILNALSGFEDKSGVIRIFTANNSDAIIKYPALLNRMSRTYRFDYPTKKFFLDKFNWLKIKLKLQEPDQADVDKLTTIASEIRPKLTLRPFTDYCTRYMLSLNDTDSGLDYMSRLLDPEHLKELEA